RGRRIAQKYRGLRESAAHLGPAQLLAHAQRGIHEHHPRVGVALDMVVSGVQLFGCPRPAEPLAGLLPRARGNALRCNPRCHLPKTGAPLPAAPGSGWWAAAARARG
nr:hypothetical protein [Tanacetum cinerariifolium]